MTTTLLLNMLDPSRKFQHSNELQLDVHGFIMDKLLGTVVTYLRILNVGSYSKRSKEKLGNGG